LAVLICGRPRAIIPAPESQRPFITSSPGSLEADHNYAARKSFHVQVEVILILKARQLTMLSLVLHTSAKAIYMP